VEEIRRAEDGELCGRVVERDGRWEARTVFGGVLGSHADRADARDQVLAEGLASLAERWTLRDGQTGDEEIACIVEAGPDAVTVVLGYAPEPGAPVRTITATELAAGTWSLTR
jgi:hypothetical protein